MVITIGGGVECFAALEGNGHIDVFVIFTWVMLTHVLFLVSVTSYDYLFLL